MPQPDPDAENRAEKFAAMLEKPPQLPDPVFRKATYLHDFAMNFFSQLILGWQKPELVKQITFSGGSRQGIMLRVGQIGFWAFDFDEKSDRGVSGRDDFLDRVKNPIRRPPANIASFTSEQHILTQGVIKIQIAEKPLLVPPLPGGFELATLKTIGWYAAEIVPSHLTSQPAYKPPVPTAVMSVPDTELEQMLAEPELLAEPVFSKDSYLAQAAHGLFGHFLRVTKQPQELLKQVRQAHAEPHRIGLQAGMFVAWTYDLDIEGSPGQSGRDLFSSLAKLPATNAANNNSYGLKEHVLGRRVLRIQVEADNNSPNSPHETQPVRLRNLGWYVAGLVRPVHNPTGQK